MGPTLDCRVFIMPKNKHGWVKGELAKCIKQLMPYDELDKLHIADNTNENPIVKGCFVALNLFFISEDKPLKVDDWCLFYGQPSKVLEINGTQAKIDTQTIISESDAELINSIKGAGTVKVGDTGNMVHSFSISQLHKIVATSNIEYDGLPLIPQDWIKNYYVPNNGKIKVVKLAQDWASMLYPSTGQPDYDWNNDFLCLVKTKDNEVTILENLY